MDRRSRTQERLRMECIDRSGRLLRIEPGISVKDGWVKFTITHPKERNYGSTWEFPIGKLTELKEDFDLLQELIDNLTNLKE